MTKTIFDAVRASNVRALVSAGWGGLGGEEVPEGVFILGESSLNEREAMRKRLRKRARENHR